MRLVTMLLVLSVILVSSVAFAEKEPVKPGAWSRGLLDCSNAEPISCGAVVQGSTVGLVNNVNTYSCSGWDESGPEKVYVLDLSGTRCWIINGALSGMSGNDQDVFLLTACDEGQCIEYGDASFTSDCLDPGVYYIVVDGYNGASGGYTLTVNCTECDCPVPPCCPFPYTCLTFDFNESPNGFVTMPCGGASVWQWGPPTGIPSTACDGVPVTNVLGTVLAGTYLASSGEIAAIGPITLDACCWCMELCHFYDTESGYDGGNVKISTDGGVTWTLITPARLYDRNALSYGMCIPLEPVFSGHQFNTAFLRDCFDVSEFIGMPIWVGFFFGSDSSLNYPGWYIKWVKFGGFAPSGAEESSWGSIKAMYR